MDAVPDEDAGEAKAEKNDCETSERMIDARFWLFVNLLHRYAVSAQSSP